MEQIPLQVLMVLDALFLRVLLPLQHFVVLLVDA